MNTYTEILKTDNYMSATPKSISAAAKADDESKISKAPLQEEVEDSIDKVEVLPS